MPRSRKSAVTTLRKSPRQERSRDTVAAILDGTARVLVRRGYAHTNTNLVARAAGVSVGSLYQYFPGKEALVAALHERHARDLLAVMDAAVAGASGLPLEETVRALIHAVIEAHSLDPELHRVLEGEVPDLDRSDGLDGVLCERVHALLRAHRARIAPTDLELAAHVVMRIVDTLVHMAVIEPRNDRPVRALEREIVRAVLGYLERR
jgi:AcrR family transcriptional regulator